MVAQERMRPRAAATRWVEAAILAAVLVVLARALIPLHITSIWLDKEFSGWVAPLADRFATGQRLYADGGHSPLPPLSFALVYLLTLGHATWHTERVLNALFQALQVLVLYLGLSRRLPLPVPFIAALGTIPIFTHLGKSLLYDSLTQFFVALVATIGALHVTDTSRSRRIGIPCALGALSAACVLSKQNTGAGAMLGTLLLLLIFPRPASARSRVAEATVYLVSAAVAFAVLCVALSPLISVPGLLVDVFLTGSEPKGGPARMMSNLVTYSYQLGGLLLWFGSVAALFLWAAPSDTNDGDEKNLVGSYYSTCVAAGAGAAWTLSAWYFQRWQHYNHALDRLGEALLSLGLVVCLGATAAVIGRRRARRDWSTLAAFTVATFPAAIFHGLSVPRLRWTYDNNSLIMVAIAGLLTAVWSPLDRLAAKRFPPFAALTFAMLALVSQAAWWTRASAMIAEISRCSVAWPEVSHLAGAKLGENAAGMRELVAMVRLAAPRSTDEVLLLPEDPNVEMWFERRRPALTSAIVFTDQYWARYVDEDFRRLEDQPPAVVIIGPRNSWRISQLEWNPGAAQLIGRVQNELLPRLYTRHLVQPIVCWFCGRAEFMDVYIR